MELYHDNIKITAYEDVESRYKRLERVVGYICALSEHYGNSILLSKIKKLHDYKGTLEVYWNIYPAKGEIDFLVKAWNSLIGDGCDDVQHYDKNENELHTQQIIPADR